MYKEVTFEEYYKAKKFAKIRYRFGVFIQLIALILFIFLILYTVKNVEEMKANPIDYAEEKMGVVCFQPLGDNYGSSRNIKSIREE